MSIIKIVELLKLLNMNILQVQGILPLNQSEMI